MTTDIATPLPQIELGPGAALEVDVGGSGAVVTSLTVYGTYYGPDSSAPAPVSPLFVPVPAEALPEPSSSAEAPAGELEARG